MKPARGRLRQLLCATLALAFAPSAAQAANPHYIVTTTANPINVTEGENFEIEFTFDARNVPPDGVLPMAAVRQADCWTKLDSQVPDGEFRVGAYEHTILPSDWCGSGTPASCHGTITVWGTTTDDNCNSGNQEFQLCVFIADAFNNNQYLTRGPFKPVIVKSDDDTALWQSACD